ncbi:BglG family transcription antiterminator [Lactiplantibacillus nangangensis]|uniref:BglG family transcription antiterminator n=1 Tax=Lactiplantibacillus nangangensis TaxID=2559917 RepID=A0ABW1SFR1_9LACO|nr:PTS sugar transporter subunit IIA [Lactiplantibacillus nangangensis]
MSLETIKHGKAVLNLLLEPQIYVSFDKINSSLHISRRTFFYTVKKLNDYLADRDLDPIQNMKGVGYYLSTDTKKALLQESQQAAPATPVFPQQERHILIMLSLVNGDKVSLENTQRRFNVTHHTAVSDFKALRESVKKYHLTLVSSSAGTTIKGIERDQRNWFLTAISDHGALINTVLAIDPEMSLKITELLRQLEKQTGNYFSDDTLTIFITFFCWYLNRLTNSNENHLLSSADKASLAHDTLTDWARSLLSMYKVESEEEVAFITYLVKSGQFVHVNTNNSIAQTIRPIVKQVIIRFNDLSGSDVSSNTLEVPLLTHLLSTYYRVKYHIRFKQPSLNLIMKQYDELVFFTRMSLKPFEELIHQSLSDEEVTLVAIYFGGMLRSQSKNDATVEVVCSSGIGTSRILYEELTRRYPNVRFSKPMSVFKHKNSSLVTVRLIISTIKLSKDYQIPAIVVAPIPTPVQWQQINQELAKLGLINKASNTLTVTNLMDLISEYARITDPVALESALTNLISKNKGPAKPSLDGNFGLKSLLPQDNIQISDDAFDSWNQAIQLSFKPLLDNQSVSPNYVTKIIDSTKKFGPYMVIGNGVMLAHARPADGVNKIGMSLLILKHPIELYDQNEQTNKEVSVIIGLAPIDAAEHVLALSQLVKLLQKPNWLTTVKTATDTTAVYNSYIGTL